MEAAQLAAYAMTVFAAAMLVIWILAAGIFVVNQQTAAVIEHFGRFHRIAQPGLHFKIPIVQRIRERTSLRVQQLDVRVESKSQDNVFVELAIAVQFQVKIDAIADAVYRLTDHARQIEAYVFDVVRAEVPKKTLEEVFEDKETIALAVKEQLTEQMGRYGWEIANVLVNDINPDARVKAAMNQVQAATREREAAAQMAEANRITIVKQAEAEADRARLQGEGLANQRKAIAEGLRESVELVRGAGDNIREQDVMNLLLLVQWMDTQKEIAGTNRSTVVFLPNSPGEISSIADQIRASILVAEAANVSNVSNQGPNRTTP
ncbi:MAG: SPFH domain-containing protein [Dehalococcoidia bacterium]|nr:SPFH domain-containing protein [Dehalococcoidia bacterium]